MLSKYGVKEVAKNRAFYDKIYYHANRKAILARKAYQYSNAKFCREQNTFRILGGEHVTEGCSEAARPLDV